MSDVYKGYQMLTGTSSEINADLSDSEFLNGFVCNEYLLIHNTETGESSEMRFDGEKFTALRLPPSKYIKAKNALQRCALDILNNQDITVAAILGGPGSGKTHLTIQMAKFNVLEKGHQAKILCVRTPTAQGKEVGYLKGDFFDKVQPFLIPFIQQLDGGEFEYESLRTRGILDANIIFYMKGTTYPSTCMLVDEAEDLKKEEIKLVGTRIGEGSRIFFSGDYRQAVFDTSINNPLIQMCNQFKGNPLFACIYLGEDVRSETSKLFADLFEDNKE